MLEDIKVVAVSSLSALGSNKVNREKAGKTKEIKNAYDMAELRVDVQMRHLHSTIPCNQINLLSESIKLWFGSVFFYLFGI